MKSIQATAPSQKTIEKPGPLQISIAQTSTDWEVAHQFLNEEHFLGAGREADDRLCQFILDGTSGDWRV